MCPQVRQDIRYNGLGGWDRQGRAEGGQRGAEGRADGGQVGCLGHLCIYAQQYAYMYMSGTGGSYSGMQTQEWRHSCRTSLLVTYMYGTCVY